VKEKLYEIYEILKKDLEEEECYGCIAILYDEEISIDLRGGEGDWQYALYEKDGIKVHFITDDSPIVEWQPEEILGNLGFKLIEKK